MIEYVLIGSIAFVVSVISGMLGLGGAIMLIPAYLYLPQFLGFPSIDIKNISGMTSVQVFSVSLLGMLIHKKRKAFNRSIVLNVGIPIVISSFLGAALSGQLNSYLIIAAFALMAFTGAALILLNQKNEKESADELVRYNKITANLIGVFVGFFGGIAGAPGAFLLSPLLMTVLKIPTRITIGSTLGIVFLAAFATSIGKLTSGIVPLDLTITAIIFSLPGVYLGSILSHKFNAATLKWALAFVIILMGIDMGYQILF